MGIVCISSCRCCVFVSDVYAVANSECGVLCCL